jgi:hypothetical protein
MERTNTPAEEAAKANREANAPEDRQARRDAELRAATHPTSGAAVQHALAGASIAADDGSAGSGETADALKRAAENDGRV